MDFASLASAWMRFSFPTRQVPQETGISFKSGSEVFSRDSLDGSENGFSGKYRDDSLKIPLTIPVGGGVNGISDMGVILSVTEARSRLVVIMKLREVLRGCDDLLRGGQRVDG